MSFDILWLELVLGFFSSFAFIALRTVQTKNVAGDHERLAVVTSYLMTASEFISFGLFLRNGWIMFLPCGTGAAAGVVCAMRLHRRFVKPRAS